MKKQPNLKIIYWTTLLLLTVSIWQQLYSAQFLAYDDNYAVLGSAFLLSVLATLLLTILWFKASAFIKQNSLPTILFVLASSPLTVALVFYFYQELFGQLKN